MPALLSVHPAEQATRRALLEEGDALTVGRDPGCDLVPDDPRISKRHARLEWTGAGWTLHDLGSKNGTSVNGLSATGQVLADGDWLSFGGVPGRFELLSREQADARRARRQERADTSVRLRRRLAEAPSPEELVHRLLESAREVVGGERGFVLLAGADGTLHVETASWPDDRGGFRGSVSAVRRAQETGRAVIVSDVAADATLARRPSVVQQQICALACLPLRCEGRTTGFLYVDTRRPGTVLDDLDVEILEGLAEHAAVALGAASVRQRLMHLRGHAEGAMAALAREIDALRVHVDPS